MVGSARLAVLRIALAMVAGTGLCARAQAAGGLTLLADQALPVAVHDGGVAEVTVRAIPFALGSATLDVPTATALSAYLAAAATDCFLFAQAVGHVRPGPQGDGDTLAAHRLARARSETVNAALIAAGLPADAVTSVWDRQFTAREPRVTLWMFARPAGDDCAGTSLPGAVAQVAVVPARPQRMPATEAARARARLEPAPGIHLIERTAAAHGPGRLAPVYVAIAPPTEPPQWQASTAVAARLQPAQPVPRPHAALVEPKPVVPRSSSTPGDPVPGPHALRAEAMPGPVAAAASLVTVAAAVAEPAIRATSAAAVDAEPEAGPDPSSAAGVAAVAPAAARKVEISFKPDSSYLEDGAETQLAGLLAALPRDTTWEVELQAAVGDVAGRLPADRARAYNEWLAERRQSRVEDWLGMRPGAPVLRVRRSMLPHDPTRRLVISARPLP